jgi:hypothetical protein
LLPDYSGTDKKDLTEKALELAGVRLEQLNEFINGDSSNLLSAGRNLEDSHAVGAK